MVLVTITSLAGVIISLAGVTSPGGKPAGRLLGAGSSSLAIPGCTCEAEAGRATSAREEAVPTWFGFGLGFGLGLG